MSRSHYAGTDASHGGCSDLWRWCCRWDNGANSEVGHSGPWNQSPTPRKEEVKGQPQVMYGLKEYLNPVFTLTEDYIWYLFMARSNLNSLQNQGKKKCVEYLMTSADVKILNAWLLTTATISPDSEADSEEWSDPRGSTCTGTHWLPWYLRVTMNQPRCRGYPAPASVSCLPSTMFLAAFACCVWVMKLQPWYFVLRQQNATVNMGKGDTSTV